MVSRELGKTAGIYHSSQQSCWTCRTSINLAELEYLLSRGVDIEQQDGPKKSRALHEAAKNGQIASASFLLNKDAHVDSPDGHYYPSTLTRYAVLAGDVTMAQFLLSKGADVMQNGVVPDGTLVLSAAKNRDLEMITLLLDLGVNIESPIHLAIAWTCKSRWHGCCYRRVRLLTVWIFMVVCR